jgi:glycosyltransferase involved in cell wall biosynthesis
MKMMQKKKVHFYFISVSTISSIPLIRFIVDAFEGQSMFIFIETQIKRANSYFQGRKNIRMAPLFLYEDYYSYYASLGKKSFTKYAKLIFRLIKLLFDKKSILYTADFQIIALVVVLKKILPFKQAIIYHQFEVINDKKQGKATRLMYDVFVANLKIVDLFIFPEVNRMNYFLDGKNIAKEKLLIFPNTTKLTDISNTLGVDFELPKGKKICLHVGAIGGENHYFIELLEAIKRMQSQNFVFVFVGRLSNEVKSILEAETLNNLIIIPSIPHEQLSVLYLKADLGIILYKGPGINYEFCAPNKLYEFWSFGIPVLAHKLEGLKSIFNNDFQGKLIDFENVDNAVDALINIDTNENMRKKLKNYFNENLTVDHYLDELKTILIEKKLYECK